ncbi:MAG: dihydrofolate synthase/folylpolyglutamate synthase [Limisphaerales bacterium]|jgi:dihydrofolate synthase/folylpolyglutamate synthase
MNYAETLDFLFSRLPMFQRQGPMAMKKDLTNILALMQALGRPHLRFPAIHVAGTNGKGSVSHMLASVLGQAQYKVGLYTSPHLNDFRERIRINGIPVSQSFVVDFVENNTDLIERIKPSFFEITVAMAFCKFAEEEIDIAIIETGLGGRLDSTNIINPLVSVITNIGYDHQNFLGDTLREIAGEKAGIIKPGIPVVIGKHQDETMPVFELKAKTVQAPLFMAEEGIDFKNVNRDIYGTTLDWYRHGKLFIEALFVDLGGQWQIENIKSTIQTLLLIEEQGFLINNDAWISGFSNIKLNTGFKGRWHLLQNSPIVLADGAHNKEGLKAVFSELNNITFKQLHIVIGMVDDKDSSEILMEYPKEAIYWFCGPDIPRGKPSNKLADEASLFGLKGSTCASVNEAITRAMSEAKPDDLILITGSLFVIAEIPFEKFGPVYHSNRSPST